MLADIRLYQLISPTLPVGGFTYSQGLEWAVEAQWVHDKATLKQWLQGLLAQSIGTLELPILLRLQQALTSVAGTQLAGMALAAHCWEIAAEKTCAGYTWSWLENIVMAGVKLIPLGQTHGQQILLELGSDIPQALAAAQHLPDDEIGSSTPALAIASSRHESQYTRLFRS